jgi:hypothetical protein
MKRVLATVIAMALTAAPAAAAPLPMRHVFVIVLENHNFDVTFGTRTEAPYLAKTLRRAGAFVPNYYGVTHASLGNYIALVSGQGSNGATQSDCQYYTDLTPGTPGADSQALGQGCVYPPWVKTLPDQLNAAGLRWRLYMEDMGNDPTRENATCGRPRLGTRDQTWNTESGDEYVARHNPAVYFHSILDGPTCTMNDVRLDQLRRDLAAKATTPNFALIAPNNCHNGHPDEVGGGCQDGGPSGLLRVDQFLRKWVPRILAAPAFKTDGLLVITFDEAELWPQTNGDAGACCNEPQFPNTINNGGVLLGRGGGRVGAVTLSPLLMPGSVDPTPYNHFSLLRGIEDAFGLGHLGYAAQAGLVPFGSGMRLAQLPPLRLSARPRQAQVGELVRFWLRVTASGHGAVAGATLRIGGQRRRTNRAGLAHVRLRLRHSGSLRIVARASGFRAATVRVRVKRGGRRA